MEFEPESTDSGDTDVPSDATEETNPSQESEPVDQPSEIEEATPVAVSYAPGLIPVALLPHAGQEPALNLSDDDGQATWVAATALWHPLVLSRAESLPRFEDVFGGSSPEAREIRLVTQGWADRVPSGLMTQSSDLGSVFVEGTKDRAGTVQHIAEKLGIEVPELTADQTEIAADFLALGAAAWWLGDLTTAMNHSDAIDRESLARETLTAARCWESGDLPTAKNRLRAAFEVLTQGRERVYPVDSYLLDLCLLDPASRPEELTDALAQHFAFTLLAPARAIENVAERDPEKIAALRTAIDEGWADVIGGAYTEADEPLLPINSVLWQFRKGGQVYRDHLDGRNVETLGRRRFGLYPQLPQIAKRFGQRFALHLGFDAGKFPIRPEMKRLWEGLDNSTLETLNRPPIAGDRPSEGVRLPWRLAKSMRDDFTAAVGVIHWAGRFAGWFGDLRRAHKQSPVLMRFSTINDFFHVTDRPYDTFHASLDDYVFPYLDQAVKKGDTTPISGRATHTRSRARFDAIAAIRGLAMALGQEPADRETGLDDAEDAIELGRPDESIAALDQAETAWPRAFATGVLGKGNETSNGYLVINPCSVARRVSVVLPDAQADLRPEGPLRAAQLTEDGVRAIVDVSGYGYAWVAGDSSPSSPMAKLDAMTTRDRTMQNESMSVTIDSGTGGIRGINGPNEPTARIGQQLIIHGLLDADGKPALSKMRETSFEPEYGGPALLQVSTEGTLHHPADDRVLAKYRQRYRLWSGRTTLEIQVMLSDVDEAWFASLAKADPWTNYLGCRWAWPDAESTLRRSSFLTPVQSTVDRMETPDYIDISSRKRRTSLIFGGLAHHRRIRPRMLDTILIAGKESARTFELGVALDLENPWHAAIDAVAPAFVVPVQLPVPKSGPSGWLLAVDSKGVTILSVQFLERSGDGRGWGLDVTLLETSGRASRCKLRTFRDPTYARQVDFNDEVIVDLPIDGDGVYVDLTPHELARVDITMS